MIFFGYRSFLSDKLLRIHFLRSFLLIRRHIGVLNVMRFFWWSSKEKAVFKTNISWMSCKMGLLYHGTNKIIHIYLKFYLWFRTTWVLQTLMSFSDLKKIRKDQSTSQYAIEAILSYLISLNSIFKLLMFLWVIIIKLRTSKSKMFKLINEDKSTVRSF